MAINAGSIERVELVVVGAGPAGMAAAVTAAESGVETLLLDEQDHPGGQIYRGITHISPVRAEILGPDYRRGRPLYAQAAALQAGGPLRYQPASSVWQITNARELYFNRNHAAAAVQADSIIIAPGAYERPMPFSGWTLPGVMTAGAGQILLKTAALRPTGPLVLAGSGPLLLLLACQILNAGGAIAALVDTTPKAYYRQALRYCLGALRNYRQMSKGLAMLAQIYRQRLPVYRGAEQLTALGDDQVEALSFTCKGRRQHIPCTNLLIHNGVVPNVQFSRALRLTHLWQPLQRYWYPKLGSVGETECDGIYIVGDGGGIVGAEAAQLQGHIAGLHAAQILRPDHAGLNAPQMRQWQSRLRRHLAIRPFLDCLYAPAANLWSRGDDDVVICRCEEVTAGEIRQFVDLGCLGANQAKAFGRCGMGPCQGRLCGLSVNEVIADARKMPIEAIEPYRIRPPIKPVDLGALAALHDQR